MDPYEDMLHARPARRGLLGAVAGALFAAVGLVSVPSLLTSATAQQAYADCYIDIMDGYGTVTCVDSEPLTPNAVAREDSGQTSTSAEAFEVNENILILDEGVGDVYLEVNRPLEPAETLTLTFYAGGSALGGEKLSNGNGFKTILNQPELSDAAKTMGARLFGGVSQRGGKYYLHFTIRDDNLSAPDNDRPTSMQWNVAGGTVPTSGNTAVRWDDDDGRHITCGDVRRIHSGTSNGGSVRVSLTTYKLPYGEMLTIEYQTDPNDGTRVTSVDRAYVQGYEMMSKTFTAQGAC